MFFSSWHRSIQQKSLVSRHLAYRGSRLLWRRPELELLEQRLAPATIIVTTTNDDLAVDGTVSLREAIASINAGANSDADVFASGTYGTNDTIDFSIPGSGVETINVGSTGNGALPALTMPAMIDGNSQPGASANTQANSDNAMLLIELNGASAGPNANGLEISGGNSTIQGLAINRFTANGLLVDTNGGDTIRGNFVGTNPLGTVAEPNGLDGIRIVSESNNSIGGTSAGDRNILSGNASDGLHIFGALAAPATGNLVEGNFVGVSAAGTGSVGVRPSGPAAGIAAGNFAAGIEVDGGNNNTVGGTAAGARNVVGFNLDGIELDNGAQNNAVQENFSGVGG